MPFYEYQCSHCNQHLEVMQKISEPPLRKCPSCGRNTLKKLMSAPVFRLKGSGWYETDFKSDQEGKRNLAGADKDEAPSKAETAAEAKAGATGETKAETKTDGKSETKSEAKTDSKSDAKGEARTEAKAESRGTSRSSKSARSPDSASRAPAGRRSAPKPASRPARAGRAVPKPAGRPKGGRRSGR